MGNVKPTPLAVTINDACRITGIGRSKLYQEINAGRLQLRKAGQRSLIRLVDLRAYIDALPQWHPQQND